MLYLDASALVKRYVREKGSAGLEARFEAGERVFTSVLSYAEVQAALGKLYRLGKRRREAGLRRGQFVKARRRFVEDWLFSLNILELNTKTMTALPGLVERYPLRAADAAHLSSALWLRDMCSVVPGFSRGDATVEFAVADKKLAQMAGQCGLVVFNPEDSG